MFAKSYQKGTCKAADERKVVLSKIKEVIINRFSGKILDFKMKKKTPSNTLRVSFSFIPNFIDLKYLLAKHSVLMKRNLKTIVENLIQMLVSLYLKDSKPRKNISKKLG